MKASFKVNISPVFYLWVGQGISSIGSMVYNIALAWYVMKQTGSPLVMGTVLLVGMVPKIVLSIIAGIVGDKVSKKKFLIIVDLLRFTLTTAWGISLIGRAFNLVEVYIFTFLLSMVDAVFNPVYGALIPELIKKDNVTRTASINQMVFRTVTILAPSVAGFAIMLLNFSQFVLFNGITFLVGALFTSLLRINAKLIVKIKKSNLFSDLKNGLVYFWGHKLLFWSVFLITLANIAVVSYNVNLVNLIQNELQFSSNDYGVVLTFYSLGSFLGTMTLGMIKLKSRRGYVYIVSLLLGGLFYICIPFIQGIIFLCLIFFFIGFVFAITSTISTAILFAVPSEEFRSRVLGIASISSLLSPLGFLIWGAIGSYVSSAAALCLAGGIILIVGFIGFRTPIRTYN
ncbi:putative MFS-type transporter [Paenibacillus larvae subsp. larvae]|uniref:Putative MFS-type transporter n=1 Tax=Paenibacillus larvae subsp. larvae TaxID=147375 RepID=A0A2L1UDC2_9BACL|nr:MFS transporter [Paenibacillus larvae]AQT86532.1 hypothetical protein B1222_22490 [Paenibacillus larvae subsp. pulvifaciens]AQZ48194.1 hypothetical protein B5S25_18050 [Paenibacillus larvae subsp. pulvifaciens]AVF26160.1 putative MFS-type transporter [Paenibacillus larvae subsp. larvae]AVF30937.1 putative MFS-type transporter [Paenibacillus larvae subsp. larvae]MBH0343990.1 hypothetical protein [Paenibacillus larvae]